MDIEHSQVEPPLVTVNEHALKSAIIEIKLFVNRRLYEKGALTEEMYMRAKELILKDEGTSTYSVS